MKTRCWGDCVFGRVGFWCAAWLCEPFICCVDGFSFPRCLGTDENFGKERPYFTAQNPSAECVCLSGGTVFTAASLALGRIQALEPCRKFNNAFC